MEMTSKIKNKFQIFLSTYCHIMNIIITKARSQVPNILDLVHAASFLEHLCESVSDKKRYIDESLHTVRNTCLCP